MALGLGLVKLKQDPEPEPYPLQYETSFVLNAPDNETTEASLSVNHPFRRGPLALYQMGYEQKITLQVGRKTIEVEPYKPFKVEGLKGRFMLGEIKWGKMKKKDGSVVDLSPRAYLYRLGDTGKERLGLLKKDRHLRISGRRWRIKDFREASVLSYRVDRGVPLAGLGTTVAVISIFLRAFGRFMRVSILREGDRLYLRIQTSGVFTESPIPAHLQKPRDEQYGIMK